MICGQRTRYAIGRRDVSVIMETATTAFMKMPTVKVMMILIEFKVVEKAISIILMLSGILSKEIT